MIANGGTYGVDAVSTADTGTGVAATGGRSGTGVDAYSSAGTGVSGRSSSGYGGSFEGGVAQVHLVPSHAAVHPASGQPGDLFVDVNSNLWFCKGGTTWKQLA